MMRKSLFPLLGFIVVVLSLFPLKSSASHFMGMDISYECIGSCTIRVYLRIYRDCSGSDSVDPDDFEIDTPPGCIAPTPIGGWSTEVITEVTPVCPGAITCCAFGPFACPPGVPRGSEEYYFQRDYNFCSANCSNYTLSWAGCCRNIAITSIDDPNSVELESASTVVNPLISPCNNSPQFSNPPVPFICENQPFTFNQGAFDPDGDSLAYFLGPCYDAGGIVVPYYGGLGYGPTSPLGPDWLVTIDAVTGDVAIVPNPASPTPGAPEVGVMCVYVEEWRGGVMIGTVYRDIQISVIPCPANEVPQIFGMSNLTGASLSTVSNYVALMCLGNEICFDIPAVDPDSGQVITMFWNHALSPLGGVFSDSAAPGVLDTISHVMPTTGHFCWTPSAPGSYSFLVTVRDDACPLYGQNQYTFQIIVSAPSITASWTQNGCTTVDFCVSSVTGNDPFVFTWTGDAGLTSSDSCFSWTYPASDSSYAYQLVMTDSVGCTSVVFFDTVYINPPPTASVDSVPDLCFDTHVYDFNVSGTYGPTATFLWTFSDVTPPTSTLENPTGIVFNTPGPQWATVTVTEFGCETEPDTVFFNIFDTFIFPDAGPDDSVCTDEPLPLNGSVHANATYLWDPPTGLSDPTIPNPVLTLSNPGTTIVTQDYIYAVTDTIFGCTEFDTVTITIFPRPEALFDMNDTVCQNEPVIFNYPGWNDVTASYGWLFGATAVPPFAVGQGPHVVTWPDAGTYPVSLIVAEYGCTSSIYLDTVFVRTVPTAVIDPEADQCFNENSFDFNSIGTYGPNATFAWEFSGATPLTSTDENPTGIVYNSPGFHWATLTVSDSGCVSEPDTIFFEVIRSPDPSFLHTDPTIYCFEDHFAYVWQIGVNGPTATYTWDFGPAGIPPTSTALGDTVRFLYPGEQPISLTVVERGCVSIAYDTLDIIPNPIIDAGLPVAFCEGEGGAQVGVNLVGGGIPTYYFEWWCDSITVATYCGIDSVFDNDPIVNPDASTWYYVEVTDSRGCQSDIDSVFVTVNPKPIVDAGPDIFLCGDQAPCELIDATVSNSPGPFSLLWTPSIGLNSDTILNPCARPDTTTIYTLVAVDLITGCTSEATTVDTLSSVTVHVNPIPVAEAGPDRDMCYGDSIMLLGMGYGAGPLYDYEWSPFDPPVTLTANDIPNPLAFPTMHSSYVLVVWSNGCPSYGDTVNVWVHTNPTVDAGPDRDICQGETALLDAQADGDSSSLGYTFVWWPSVGVVGDTAVEDLIAGPDTTTMYFVQAMSSWGCLSPIDSALLTVKSTPIPDAGSPLTICYGDSIVIPANYSFDGTPAVDPSLVWAAWLPADSINDTTLLQPTVWPAATGFYYLHLQQNTCHTYDSVLITVIPTPIPVVDADTTALCSDGTVQLYGSGGNGGADFDWTPGQTLSDSTAENPVATVDTTTTYILTLSEGGCSASDSITITVYPTPQAAYMSSEESGCVPHTVSFITTGVDGINYIWNFGDGSSVSNETTPTHVYDVPGTYNVVLTAVGLGGCSDTVSSIWVTTGEQPIAAFSSSPDYPAQLALPNAQVIFTDQSQFGVTSTWTFGDGGSVGEPMGTTVSHQYENVSEFMVTLTVESAEGCVDMVQHGPYIVAAPDLFIPNVFSPNDDNNNDVWIVRYTGDQPFTAQVLDRWGKLLYDSRNKTEGWAGRDLQGTDVPDGVYFYMVKVGDKGYTGEVTLLR
jgi:gliding motility-associated-like protein